MARPSRYPPEFRERAVRMVAEVLPNYPSAWPAMVAVAQKLGVGTGETVRKWVRRAEVDGGVRPGVTTEEHAEVRRLKRENAELRRANEILKAASRTACVSSWSWTRSSTPYGPAGKPDGRCSQA